MPSSANDGWGAVVAAYLDSERDCLAAPVASSTLDGRLARVAQGLRDWAGISRYWKPGPARSSTWRQRVEDGPALYVRTDSDRPISPLTSEEDEAQAAREMRRHSALLRRLDAAAASRDASHRRRRVEHPGHPRHRRLDALYPATAHRFATQRTTRVTGRAFCQPTTAGDPVPWMRTARWRLSLQLLVAVGAVTAHRHRDHRRSPGTVASQPEASLGTTVCGSSPLWQGGKCAPWLLRGISGAVCIQPSWCGVVTTCAHTKAPRDCAGQKHGSA